MFLEFSVLWYFAQHAFGQSATMSSFNHSSSATSITAPTVTGAPCCLVVPLDAGLNFWYTQPIEAVVETIITQYYHYNNTVLTNTTTIYQPNATTSGWPTTAIIGPGNHVYTRTYTVNYTSVDFGTTNVVYPTPFVEIFNVGFITGTYTENSRPGVTGTPELSCKPIASLNPFIGNPVQYVSNGYVFVEDPIVTHTVRGYAPIPNGKELIGAWIKATPTLTKLIPGLTTCSVPSGSGEPSVHVPVTHLTSHSSKTIQVGGWAPGTEPTEDPKPDPESPPSPGPTTGLPPNQQPSPPPQPIPPPVPTNSNPPLPGQSTSPSRPSYQDPPSSPGQSQIPNNPANPNLPPNPNDSVPGQNPGVNPIPITVTPVPGAPGVVLPDGQTLAPGETTTISGVEIFVPTFPTSNAYGSPPVTAPVLVVDGSTIQIEQPTAIQVTPPSITGASQPVYSITIDGDVIPITAPVAPGDPVVIPIDGTSVTLYPGSPVTLGTQTFVLSEGPSGVSLQVVEATTTQVVPLPTEANTPTVGGETPTEVWPAGFTGGVGKSGQSWPALGLLAFVGGLVYL